jgi:alkanesulfonate monooxygenase SsuD/methylene tetrahydromethanopterin reductase-like flavin-dependent oxidoreductase (luciferase family)
MAAGTDTIRLASGVLNVYSRSAMLIAQTAATLQTLSGGRFVLGLGASGPILIENWHGLPYRRPVARTQHYVNAIRLALSGARVDYEGVDFHLRGFKLQSPRLSAVPIYIAALGPKNVALTGEIADGWLPIFAARGHMQVLFSSLADGAARAGREVSGIDVAAYIPAAVGPHAELLVRQQIAYYVGGMGTFYAEMMRGMGFEDDVARVRAAWQQGDRAAAVRSLSDPLLDVCTVAGRPDVARRQLERFRSDGINLPILAPPHGTSSEEAASLVETLAPRVTTPGQNPA